MSEDQGEYITKPKSKITPNTFQTPNTLVDDFMRYLSGNETKCYLVVVRKTLGWLKRRDCISLSQIVELAGIGDGPARESMKELCRFGLVRRTAENDPDKNWGPEYELELDDMNISVLGLIERDKAKKETAKHQTNNARAAANLNKKLTGNRKFTPLLLTDPPLVEQEGGGVVEQTTQKPLSKAINNDGDKKSKFTEPEIMANLKSLSNLYETNVGLITPLLRDELISAAEIYPLAFHIPAFTAAVENNARNWAYIEKCMRNKYEGKEFPRRTPAIPKAPKPTPIPVALTEDTSRFVPPPAHLRAKAHAGI